MISQLLAASVIATTALSPSPEPLAQAVNETHALVREHVTPWFTVNVDFTCPATHPYIHKVGWGWTNEPHDNITFWPTYGDTENTPATRITGVATNWNLDTRWVEINTLCTSDVRQAMTVPRYGP